jgi:hypothetical protein
MADLKIAKGSIEFVPVFVKDRLLALSTLTGITCEFRIDDDNGEEIQDWTVASTVDMTAMCLVDSTSLDTDEYDLFLRLTILPEMPILGPFRFEII